jgi:hypothetical protein
MFDQELRSSIKSLFKTSGPTKKPTNTHAYVPKGHQAFVVKSFHKNATFAGLIFTWNVYGDGLKTKNRTLR